MTTAARPPFEPARGGRGKGEGDLSAMSKQYSSRDLPSHTKLKHRQSGQGTAEETRERDFRKELEEKEKVAKEKKTGAIVREPGESGCFLWVGWFVCRLVGLFIAYLPLSSSFSHHYII